MKIFRSLITVSALLRHVMCAGLALPAVAQQPNTLLQSIAAPASAQTGAGLGFSVAVDDRLTVVGAPYDDLARTNAGVVKVFDSTTGVLLHVLANPAPEPLNPPPGRPSPPPVSGDFFGSSVAISGTRVVVGVPGDNTSAYHAGIAYVYDLDSDTPTVPAATLRNPDPAVDDNFGNAVAISGTRVVVGASGDDTGAHDSGIAYVYDLNSSAPTAPAVTLHNPNPGYFDDFGGSVAMSGARVVVGARRDSTGAIFTGSAYVYDISGGTPAVPVVTLNNPEPSAYESFASSVAISGTRVVVGAPFDGTGATSSGSAYVYDLGSGTVPVVTLHNPSPAVRDYFGGSVAISGTRVVVGAYADDTGARNAGSAYVYDISGGTPTVPTITLNNPGPAASDRFGFSVAISGKRVVVGTPYDDEGALNAGSAYVFDLGRSTPTLPALTLNNPGPAVQDYFGNSVAISGTRLVVGAPLDDTGERNAGSVYVYDLASDSSAEPVLTLHNPDPAVGDKFGSSVAIYGTRVVVGAPDDGTGEEGAGSAYVYDIGGDTPTVPLVALHNPVPTKDAGFGAAVAIFETRVVVGVPYDDTGKTDAGIAYVFNFTGSTPAVPVAVLANPDPAAGDNFGFSVAISATRAVIGAPGDNTGEDGAGSVYVYDFSSATPAAILNNPDPANHAGFGTAVAISGTRVVVGTPGDSAKADSSGSAHVYNLGIPSPTVPVLALKNPGAAAGDNFGNSVAISGRRVVVGASYDDTRATDAGSAYVYDLGGDTPRVPVARLHNPGPGTDDRFGTSVAIDGTIAIIGTPFDDGLMLNKGAAYVFGPTDFDTTIISGPSGAPNGGTATFTFIAKAGTTFMASLDGAPETAVTSPATFSALGLGVHTFSVRAIDADGNADPTPATQSWRVTSASTQLRSFRTSFASDEAVPGAGSVGAPPAGAALARVGGSAVDEAGNVAFLAKWTSATAGAGTGIFTATASIAQVGGSVPGIPGATFAALAPPVLEGGHVAFLATLAGVPAEEAAVVLSDAPTGTLAVVARAGQVVAGADGAVFQSFQAVAVSGSCVAFLGKLRIGSGAPAVTLASDRGLWMRDATHSLTRVLGEGQMVDSKKIRTLVTFIGGDGSPGQGRGWLRTPEVGSPQVLALALFHGKTQAVLSAGLDGTVTALSQSGPDGAGGPAIAGANFASYGVPAANAAGHSAFRALLTVGAGGVSAVNASGIFLRNPADLLYAPVALRGDVAGATGANFLVLKDPVLASDGGIAFPAVITVGGLGKQTLWWQPPGKALTLLAQGGAEAAEIPGAQWEAFTSLAIARDRGPIFAASLVAGLGGVTPDNATGVWAVDSTGALRLLFRTGDRIGGKKVLRFNVLEAVPGSTGVTRSFNDRGEVFWLATFPDHTQTIMATTVE